jgi:hypothetical protein
VESLTQVIVLLDVGARTIRSLVGAELGALRQRLDEYDVIAALDVRALLRAIDYQPGQRRLAELGPPQNTKRRGCAWATCGHATIR